MLQPRWRWRRLWQLERYVPAPRRQRRRLWPQPGPRVSPGRERSGASPPAGLTRTKRRRPQREELVSNGERARCLLLRHHGWAHQKTDPETPLQVSDSLGRGGQLTSAVVGARGSSVQPPGRRRLAAVREATLVFSALVGAGVARPRISRQWLASRVSPWTASPRPARGGAWRAAGGDSGLRSPPTQRPGSLS